MERSYPVQKIIVATDGSEGGNRAVDFAAKLAKGSGANLIIVTIGETLTRDEARRLARAEKEDVADVLESLANRVLLDARQRAERAGSQAIETRIGWGDAAETIIEIAKRIRADVIVVGRRGRGRLSGLVMGSVSQKIASYAPCVAVLVP
jgi:nucleotide-binding universal stress UspA family protein